jgi:hypothetical protein
MLYVFLVRIPVRGVRHARVMVATSQRFYWDVKARAPGWLAPDHRTTWSVAAAVLIGLQALAALVLWMGAVPRPPASEGPVAATRTMSATEHPIATSGVTGMVLESRRAMNPVVEPLVFVRPGPHSPVLSVAEPSTFGENPPPLFSERFDQVSTLLASRSDPRLPILLTVPFSPLRGTTTAPSDGRLVVLSDPPGANVTVNGVGWGVTPLTVRYLPFGEKRVRVTKDGYRAAEEVTWLVRDRPVVTVRIALVAQR